MVAMMMTTYNGFVSIILQPIMGGFLTAVAVILVAIVGSPLLFKKVWDWWMKFKWISIFLTFVGILLMVTSWMAFKMIVFDNVTQKSVETFQPVLAFSGWFIVIFGILWCPLISVQPIVKKIKGFSTL